MVGETLAERLVFVAAAARSVARRAIVGAVAPADLFAQPFLDDLQLARLVKLLAQVGQLLVQAADLALT
jgi:hypothetical protein